MVVLRVNQTSGVIRSWLVGCVQSAPLGLVKVIEGPFQISEATAEGTKGKSKNKAAAFRSFVSSKIGSYRSMTEFLETRFEPVDKARFVFIESVLDFAES